MIVDPGVKIEKNYKAYEEGLKKNIFIKKNDGKTNLVNKCWAGLSYFPDFLKKETINYWNNMINDFYNSGAKFSGLWLDMNEFGTVIFFNFNLKKKI
jgi:alpha-glucosidase